MYHLRQETPEDWWAVEGLYDLCFAPGREALSSYRLRDDVPPVHELCRVAVDDAGVIGGAIRFWPIEIGNAPALLLGPIAVHPTHQGEGLGGALIRDTTERAFEAGWPRILLVGDAPYYARFGFMPLSHIRMPPPTNPARILGLGAWHDVSGDVRRWSGGRP